MIKTYGISIEPYSLLDKISFALQWNPAAPFCGAAPFACPVQWLVGVTLLVGGGGGTISWMEPSASRSS